MVTLVIGVICVILILLISHFSDIMRQDNTRETIINNFRTSDISVLDRLYALGTKMFATYRSGNLTITFDNGTISLSPPESQQITPQNYKEAA
jgi:hypothetical protein